MLKLPILTIRLGVAAALGTVIGSCSGWSPAPRNTEEQDFQRHAREQVGDLDRWLRNPVSELQDIDGSCVSWLDSTSCNYTFKTWVPVRLRDPRLEHVRCEDIEGLTGAAQELGFDGVAANHFEHMECFFLGGRIIGGSFVLVIHDKETQRYGIRAVN